MAIYIRVVFIFIITASPIPLIAQGNYILNKDYFNYIRHKGDSIVIEHFGLNFFKNHIEFSESSEINFDRKRYTHDWKWHERDSIKLKPDYFFLDYQIIFNDEKFQTITLTLDSNGNKYVRVYDEKYIYGGFTGLTKYKSNCKFNVDLKKLKLIAKEQGVKYKRKKSQINLRWVASDTSVEVGSYQLEMAIFTGKETLDLPTCTKIYNVYDVILVDPWSGVFIRKTKMKGLIYASTKVTGL